MVINMKNLSQNKIDDFFSILKEGKIKSVFQPIVSLKNGEILGYEALSRITSQKTNLSIEELFNISDQLGCLWQLEKVCRRKAVKSAEYKPTGKKLFLNVDCNVIQDSEFVKGFTKDFLHKHNLKTKDVVFEITERHDFENTDLFKKVMKHYQSQGFEISIDDLGSKYSGLNRINCMNPQYIKIDIELVHNIQNSKSQRSLVSMLVKHCNEMNYTLIAEGIETQEELECLHKLGVPYGQGFYLGKPDTNFQEIDENIKKEILNLNKEIKDKKKKCNLGTISKMGWVLYPGCNALRAYNIFLKDEKLTQIAVVDSKNHFYGLIHRELFLNNYKTNTYKTKKDVVSDWIEDDTLILDEKDSFKKAVSLTMMRPDEKCYEPFAVLKDGRYYGIVTIRDLVIAMSGKNVEDK